MTYCVGLMVDSGLIFASDSRTHYSVGNFIEASDQTPYLQTGEAKYGKPIIDWDSRFDEIERQWSEDTRQAFRRLPDLDWTD